MNLTEEQQIEISAIIGQWYSEWKHKIVDYDNQTHSLGYAKEQLKERICKVKE